MAFNGYKLLVIGTRVWHEAPKQNFDGLCSLVSSDDLIEFLQKCQSALLPNGLICLKENIATKRSVTDKADSSITRYMYGPICSLELLIGCLEIT